MPAVEIQVSYLNDTYLMQFQFLFFFSTFWIRSFVWQSRLLGKPVFDFHIKINEIEALKSTI